MFRKLENIIKRINSDYCDIRYERKQDTRIEYNGEELTRIGANSTDGFVLRVLKDGGLSSVSFTNREDAGYAIEKAIRNAELMGSNISNAVSFSDTEIVKDEYFPELKEDPREISIDEKLEITGKYNEIPLKYDKIVTTHVTYNELIREKYFLSSEGARIREDLITTRLGGTITAGDGNILQNVRVGIGGSNGFSTLRNREEEFEDKSKIAIDLLDAKSVKGGIYNVILNPDIAGVFTHEAFGHFSEADIIEDNPSIREKMELGAKLGNNIVNIIDDPTMKDKLGFYKYDDEGIRARPTQLMKDGVLVGRLHSRRTASAFGEPVTGHCVAEDYRYAPIIRMGTIYIEPGEENFEQLVSRIDNGFYIIDSKGGQTSGENFTFGAQYGYEIKNGNIGEMIRDINISGNLYQTLKNIVAIGDKIALSEIGGCGKGQLNIRSCHGAPHILVNNVVIGGI